MTRAVIHTFTLRTFKYAPKNKSLYKAFQKAIDKINTDIPAEWRHLYNNPLFKWEVKLDTYKPLKGEPYKAYTKMLHVRGQHGYGFSIIDKERVYFFYYRKVGCWFKGASCLFFLQKKL